MNNVIKFIIQQKYKKLEEVISDNEFDDADYQKLSYLFTHMYLNNYINGDQLFCFFYLCQQYIEFRTFVNIRAYTNNTLYKFLKNKKEMILVDVSIDKIIIQLKSNSKDIFKSLNKINFHNKFNVFIKLMNSHIDYKFCDSLYNDPNNENWKILHENQIRERLLELTRLCNMKLLLYFNIPIISNSQYCEMSFNEKVSYYRLCITKLSSAKEIIEELILKQEIIQKKNINFVNDYNIILNPMKSLSSNQQYDIYDKQYDIYDKQYDIYNKYNKSNKEVESSNMMINMINQYFD
jgi:hypothetical protein